MAVAAPSLTSWAAQVSNFEVYDENKRFLGTASVELPEVTFMSTEISGSGIAGKVDLPSRWITESLTLKLTWRSMTTYTFHLAEQQNHDLALYAAVNAYSSGNSSSGAVGNVDSASVSRYGAGAHEHSSKFTDSGEIRAMPIKINARCLPKRTAFGKFSPGELMDSESEFEITYIKVTVDGSTVLELDKFNYTLNIYGVDYAGDVKDALGLS